MIGLGMRAQLYMETFATHTGEAGSATRLGFKSKFAEADEKFVRRP
jgi:hypothetical protein